MVVDDTIQILQAMKTRLLEHKSPSDIIAALAKEILEFLHCDQVYVKYITNNGDILWYSTDSTEDQQIYSLTTGGIKFKECVIPLPLYLKGLFDVPLPHSLVIYEESLHTTSLGIVPLIKNDSTVGWVECRYFIDSHQWKRDETFILQQIAEFFTMAIDNITEKKQPIVETGDYKTVFDSMYQNKQLITIQTDENWKIIDIAGDTEAIFGVPKLALLNDENVWRHFITPKSVHSFRHLIKTMSDAPKSFTTELEICNQKLAQVSYMLVNASPVKKGNDCGWELCAIDVTEKTVKQERIATENQALNALYDISIAIQEPELKNLSDKFLSIALKAIKADAAYFVSYSEPGDNFALVNSICLESDVVSEICETINQNSILDYVYNKHDVLVLNNISTHREYGLIELVRAGYVSLVCCPFVYNESDQLLGAVVFVSKKEAFFKQSIVKFLRAAAEQVSASLNYISHFEAEKKQKASMSALYRLSHELAANSSDKLLNKAAKIIAEALPCKKIWFGLLDDIESYIVGHGGFGVKAPLLKVTIPLGNDNHVFTEVLKTKEPLFLNPDNPALERFFSKLRLKDVIVLPLQTSGHSIGVVCVEPSNNIESFRLNDLPSLINMCSEVANVIFARKLESKVQEGQKLQSAGLLASGMAHNFNNMLQAIIGVASLIQLQSPNNSAIYDAAVTIINSSKRGAELIKQMMLLTEQTSAEKKAISINNLIKSSFYSYEAILGSRVDLEMQLSENLPLVNANYDQICEALEHLVRNAKEALTGQISPSLRIFTSVVSFNNGELSANLPFGKYVCISVIDNGCGMSDDVVARCLDPFFTTKNVDSKTGVGVTSAGLGLSMTYAVMRQHGGVVNVRSNVGGGTTINLYLPALKEYEKSLPIEPNIAVMRSLSAKALIVESQGELLLNLGEKLKGLGLQPFLFPDYEDVSDKLKEDPSIKVLIVDIDHLGGRVETILKRIHSRFPNLLMFGFTYEPEKWNGVLRYLADMYVFDKPVGTWAIESIETCCKRLQIPLKLEDQIILSNGSAKRRNTLSRTMSASEVAAFRERLKKDFSLN